MYPEAERAYSYGERHFDGRYPRAYNIRVAHYYFSEALKLNPDMPLVKHQLARVAFLENKLYLALELINQEIRDNPSPSPSSYYIRGLILGYLEEFDSAAESYRVYVDSAPPNWAGFTDYAWVLSMAGRYEDTLDITSRGLMYFPENPWLLNTRASALAELGRYEEALDAVSRAKEYATAITEEAWSTYYPGNDPRIAQTGIKTFRDSIDSNFHMISLERDKQAKQ